MSIFIDNVIPNTLPTGDTTPAKPEGTKTSTETPENALEGKAPLKTDTVNIQYADRLKQLETQVIADTTPNPKVAQLRAAIANGEYHIDADKVAAKLVAFEDLLK